MLKSFHWEDKWAAKWLGPIWWLVTSGWLVTNGELTWSALKADAFLCTWVKEVSWLRSRTARACPHVGPQDRPSPRRLLSQPFWSLLGAEVLTITYFQISTTTFRQQHQAEEKWNFITKKFLNPLELRLPPPEILPLLILRKGQVGHRVGVGAINSLHPLGPCLRPTPA